MRDTSDYINTVQMYMEHKLLEARKGMDLFMMDIIDVTKYAINVPKGAGAEEGFSRFLPEFLDAYTVNGSVVGFPASVDMGVLHYRKDLMKKYGFCTCDTAECKSFGGPQGAFCDPPRTWDELERMARVIQDGERPSNSDFWGLIFTAGSSEDLTCRALEFFASHTDPSDPTMVGLDRDPVLLSNGTVVVNRRHTISALRRIGRWMGNITPRVVTTLANWQLNPYFLSGKAAFHIQWASQQRWGGTELQKQTGISVLPGMVPGRGRGTSGGWAIATSPYTDNVNATQALATFLSGQEGQRLQWSRYGWLPTLKDLFMTGQMCARVCPSCRNICDLSRTNLSSYIVHRPARAAAPHYDALTRVVSSRTREVLDGLATPEEAALRMECELIEVLYGIGQQPDRCFRCGAGLELNGTTGCRLCLKGRYSVRRSDSCITCPIGHIAEAAGASACSGCSPGTFAGSRGSTACATCGAGTFQRRVGQGDCTPCPPGFAQAEPGKEGCVSCDLQGFQDEQGGVSCKACPAGRSAPGRGQTTAAGCVCPADTYTRGQRCLACPQGMDCRGAHAAPEAKSGYFAGDRASLPPEAFVGVEAEFSVFECFFDKRACPGGPVGRCAPGRQGIACYECQRGKVVADDGSCVDCEGRDFLLLAVFGVAGFVLMCVAYWVKDNENFEIPSRGRIVPTLLGAIFVTSLQQVSVIGSIGVEWPEPLESVLNGVSFAATSHMMDTSCAFPLSSLMDYTWLLMRGPLLILLAVFVHIVFVIMRHSGNFRQRMPMLIFIAGTINMLFLIFNVRMSVAPFECKPHPNGLKTVLKYPSVICSESAEHVTMVWYGMAVLAVPVSFLAVCCYAVYRFPERMLRGDVRYLSAFAFLFLRFKPEAYWYALPVLLRTFAIGITPMMSDAPLQLVDISFVLLMSMLANLFILPWRAVIATILDGVTTASTLLFVCALSCFVTDEPPPGIRYVSFGLVIIVLCICFISLFVAVALFIHERFAAKPYRFFICYQKTEAGAFARYLKVVLQESLGCPLAGRHSPVFLDIGGPHGMDPDELLQVVSHKVESLVVVQTRSLLLTPWPVAQIVSAHRSRVPATRVSFHDFQEPDDALLREYTKFVNVSSLGLYAITEDMIVEALRWLRQQTSELLPLLDSHEAGLGLALSTIKRSGTTALDIPPSPRAVIDRRHRATGPNATTVTVVDHSNYEAVACALLLTVMSRLGPARSHSLAASSHSPDAKGEITVLPPGAALSSDTASCIFAFSWGCLRSHSFCGALADAAARKLHLVPVLVQDNFNVPDADELVEQIGQGLRSAPIDNGTSTTPEALAAVVSSLIKSDVVVSFVPHMGYTEEELKIHADDILTRCNSRPVADVARAGRHDMQPEYKRVSV